MALVYGALASRVPLSGYSYQWASRLANAGVGWWLGWMSFGFLSIVTVSVDYGLVSLGLGLIVYAIGWLLEPRAMRTEPGAHGADALMAERE